MTMVAASLSRLSMHVDVSLCSSTVHQSRGNSLGTSGGTIHGQEPLSLPS